MFEYLWAHVTWSTSKCSSKIRCTNKNTRYTKVTQLSFVILEKNIPDKKKEKADNLLNCHLFSLSISSLYLIVIYPCLRRIEFLSTCTID